MEQKTGMDQFTLLEERVGVLISTIVSLREGKDLLAKRNEELERINTDLAAEIGQLKKSKEEARVKVESLLEKIGGLDI